MCVDEHGKQRTTKDKRGLYVEYHAENRGQLDINDSCVATA